MADSQINAKTLRFIDGLGLREQVVFAVEQQRGLPHLARPEPGRREPGIDALSRRGARLALMR
jgi:hypothetical protein